MAFTKVTDLNADVTVSLGGTNRKTNKKNPTSVEGYYLGKKRIDDNKKKSGFSYIYFLQTPKGNVGVWGKTDMDRKMGQVTLGAMIRIEHVGMQATKNGDMYKYDVAQDLDNTIPVSDQTLETGYGGADEGGEDFSNDEDAASEEASDIDYDTPPAISASTSAERKARVEALLGKGKVRK